MPNPLGSIENSRSPAQVAHMENTVGKGVCPFCEINPTINEIICESTHWNVWHNPFPYKRRQRHLVLAAKKHIVDVRGMIPWMWIELGELLTWAQSEFNIPGGALVMRFGDLAHNGGTLRHLHAHIDVPDGTGPAFAVFHKCIPGEDTDMAAQNANILQAFKPPRE